MSGYSLKKCTINFAGPSVLFLSPVWVSLLAASLRLHVTLLPARPVSQLVVWSYIELGAQLFFPGLSLSSLNGCES